MGKRVVSDDQVAEFVSLHRAGRSYRSIGEEYGVDPRTVRAWVTRAAESEGHDHWEAVSRQVDARYVEEHYRLLVRVGASLLDVARTDPCAYSPEAEPAALLASAARSAVRQAANLFQERGLRVEPTKARSIGVPTTEAPGLDLAEHLGRNLRNALTEHEPQMRKALEEWQSSWSDFQRARRKLVEEARNLLKRHRVADKTPETLALNVVYEVLGTELLGTGPLSSLVVNKSGGLASLERHGQQVQREVYLGPKDSVSVVQVAYEAVLPQMLHPARVAPVADAHQHLVDCAQKLESLAGHLVLTGRPQGRCSLCPGFVAYVTGGARAKRGQAPV